MAESEETNEGQEEGKPCDCGCGCEKATDEAATPAPDEASKGSEEKMLPEKAQKPDADHGRKYSPFGVVVVLALLLFILWLFSEGNRYDGPAALIPAQADWMTTVNNPLNVQQKLAEFAPLKNGTKTVEQALTDLTGNLSGADQAELWQELLSYCTQVTRATGIEGTEVYIFTTGNSNAIEEILCKKMATGFVKDRDTLTVGAATQVRKLQLPGGEYFFTKMGKNAVVAGNTAALEKVIACYNATAPSLATMTANASSFANLTSEEDSRLDYTSYIVPTRTASVRQPFAVSLPGNSPETYQLDYGIVSKVRVLPEGVEIKCGSVKILKEQAPEEGHGFFYYLGVIILWLLALIIGIPVLFIIMIMIMSGYFYLVARWKGELVPIDPPELPELSKQMKQDLGQKPVPDNKTEKTDSSEKTEEEKSEEN